MYVHILIYNNLKKNICSKMIDVPFGVLGKPGFGVECCRFDFHSQQIFIYTTDNCSVSGAFLRVDLCM